MPDHVLTTTDKGRASRVIVDVRAALKGSDGKRRASISVPAAASARLRGSFAAFSWAVTYHRILLTVLAALLLFNAVIWSVKVSVDHRRPAVIRSGGILADRARAFYQINGVNFDQLAFFVNGVLRIKNTLTPDGNDMLPLLKGLISPESYEQQSARVSNAAAKLSSNFLTQSLVVTSIDHIVTDPKTGRIGAFVRGFLVITVRRGEARDDVTKLAYCADCVLDTQPVSELSPYPFYLVSITERVGDAAIAFDPNKH